MRTKISFDLRAILLLFLTMIIIISGLSTIKYSKAIDEFVDDYENEDYVQTKDDVVRNTTYNCMELNMTTTIVGGGWELINFTDFTEYDPSSRITKTDTRVTYTSITRYEHGWVYKDYGVGYWDLPLKFNFTIYIEDNNQPYHPIVNLALRNETTEWTHPNSPSEDYAINVVSQIWYSPEQPRIQFWIPLVGSDQYAAPNGNLLVKCILDVNTTDAYLYIYDVSWSLLDTLYINVTGTQTANGNWKYLYSFMNKYYGSGSTRPVRGYTEYLYKEVGEDIETEYENNGYFYTKDIRTALNGSSIVLLTNTSIPQGSITVEFSSDNSTWMDHDNVSGSETIVEGYESIDLRDLNYTNIYMRFNYTRGANKLLTPRLYQIRVITIDIVENDDYAALLIVGLIMGICIAIGIWRR